MNSNDNEKQSLFLKLLLGTVYGIAFTVIGLFLTALIYFPFARKVESSVRNAVFQNGGGEAGKEYFYYDLSLTQKVFGLLLILALTAFGAYKGYTRGKK